jgi:hypothetical protein
MISFDDLTDLPPWIKTGATLLLGAGAAKILGVWLENRRLAKKDYRDTLLSRIRELETKIDRMYHELGQRDVLIEQLRNDLDQYRRPGAQSRRRRGSGRC